METTRVVSCTFDGSLSPRAFQVSCPFPVSHIETCTMEYLTGASSNNIAIATSTLVDSQVVGLVNCANNSITTFQSRYCSYSYSVPRDIRGTYYLTLDNANFVGTVFLMIKFRG